MSGLDIIGAVAASIEIANFSRGLVHLISDITDDAYGIKTRLEHFKGAIDGIASVYKDIQANIKEQGLSESDDLVVVVSESGRHCKALLEKLQLQLPQLTKDAGVIRKAKAALTTKFNEKVIKGQLTFLDHYMQISQLALSQIKSRQISSIHGKIDKMTMVIERLDAVPPYTPETLEVFDYNRLQEYRQHLRQVAFKEKSVYDPDNESIMGRMEEIRVSPSGSADLPQVLQRIIRRVRPSTQPQQDTMGELEAKGMLLKASNVELPPGEETTKHDENRADLLIRCATIRLQDTALHMIELLWEMESRKEDAYVSPERLGRLGSKLARLYMDSQRIGHFADAERSEVSEASDFQKAIPQELVEELETQPAPVHIPPDWPRRFEPSMSPALTWCGQDNLATILGVWPDKTAVAMKPADLHLKLDVKSLDFRFDKPVAGLSSLHLAAIYEKKDILEEMLREVEDVNVGRDVASTPLMEAARSGNEETVRMLLAHEASVECADAKRGRTALHWVQSADVHNGVNVAKLLLGVESDSLLEIKDKDRKTALYLACEAGNTEMVDLLVNERNANVNVTNLYQKTALHATVDAKDRLDKRLLIAETLLTSGANPNTSDTHKHTPLCSACSLGHAELVKSLLEHGADPNLPGHQGETPLIAATRRNHTDVVLALRLKGADPNKTDATRRSALDYARLSPPTSEINHLLRGSLRSLEQHRRKSLMSVRSGLSVQSEPPPRTGTSSGSTLTSRIGRTSSTALTSRAPSAQGSGRSHWWRRSS
ncbi:endocytosis ankyrin repeat Nuc-2 [Apiospora kogelbergensis]|uniref:endocytosis ankyrin repeat Nuc-2 n=1 Tax=Apiospora kogelbergensis TaxID=1337665 RepID=UPI00313056D3